MYWRNDGRKSNDELMGVTVRAIGNRPVGLVAARTRNGAPLRDAERVMVRTRDSIF